MTVDEGKLLADVSKMHAAGQDLRTVGTAFDDLRQEYFKVWQGTDPRDDKGREKLWVASTILTQVENSLRKTIANGRIAQADIERIRKAAEPNPPKKRSGYA